MAANQTQKTNASVEDYLAQVPEAELRKDCRTLVRLMRAATGEPPRMWGAALVGFGDYHYVYDSGREGDWFLVGFAPRKQNLSIYLLSGFEGREALLERLGPHSTGKGCLYVKRLADVHLPTLEQLIADAVKSMRAWGRPKKGENRMPAGRTKPVARPSKAKASRGARPAKAKASRAAKPRAAATGRPKRAAARRG